ncbi:MAG: hypothetical protein IPH33_12745 [Bacteroidetes bacterium]|nr:hypothetical protein [Bacteroidota bacterium]
MLNNPENLPYDILRESLNGYIYGYENGKLKNIKSLYNGQTISEALYNNNGIQKLTTVKSFNSKYYLETILFDNKGQSYKVLQDDLKEQSWINWNKGYTLTGVYKNNSFWLSGTKEYGACVFQELPIDNQKIIV